MLDTSIWSFTTGYFIKKDVIFISCEAAIPSEILSFNDFENMMAFLSKGERVSNLQHHLLLKHV